MIFPIENVTDIIDASKQISDQNWAISKSILIIFMQTGLGLYEIGTVRLKNTQNVLLKILLNLGISGIIFSIFGYGLAYGEEDSLQDLNTNSTHSLSFGYRVIGSGNFALSGIHAPFYSYFLYDWAFVFFAVSIIGSSLAERSSITKYSFFSMFYCGLIYPIIAHIIWDSNGLLSLSNQNLSKDLGIGFIDCSGGGAVFLSAGIAGLIGTIILGDRIERAKSDYATQPLKRITFSEWKTNAKECRWRKIDGGHMGRKGYKIFPSASIAIKCLSILIIWYGFYGFNTVIRLIQNDYHFALTSVVSGKSTLNTTLSASGGGLAVFLASFVYKPTAMGKRFRERFWTEKNYCDLDSLLQGAFAGLISITAGSGVMFGWKALLTGFIGGIFYVLTSRLFLFMLWDDPLELTSAYISCSLWGLISATLFSTPSELAHMYPAQNLHLFQECDGFCKLKGQLLGLVIIILWSIISSLIIFITIDCTCRLRVSPIEEGMVLIPVYT